MPFSENYGIIYKNTKGVFSVAIYGISDLHLSTNTDKSMEIFGPLWSGYMERIRNNWIKTVKDDDTVIVGGDVSWEMKLEDCISDFKYLSALPGRKILFKGNHDYWWETLSKMNSFVGENNFSNIEFCHNNAFVAENIAICGSRWWIDPTHEDFKKDDIKIYNHELSRIETSLAAARKTGAENIVAVLHYPPFTDNGDVNSDISSLFKKYNVKKCIYGHLHGEGLKKAVEGDFGGVEYILTSADFLKFTPKEINFEKI